MKWGILLPNSNKFPVLGQSFMKGLRLGLAEKDLQALIEFEVEDIGFGDKLDSVREKVNGMLLKHEVEGLILWHSSFLGAELIPKMDQSEKLFLRVDLGGNLPVGGALSPFILQLSYGLWQGMWELGNYLPSQNKSKILYVGGFYEGGYQLSHAFFEGLHHGGGEIMGNFIFQEKPEATRMQALASWLEEAPPDALLVNLSAQDAEAFFEEFDRAGLMGKYPVYGPSTLLELIKNDALLDQLKEVYTVGAWSPSIALEKNRSFVEAYKQKYRKIPDMASLLGYEAALILESGLKAWDEGADHLETAQKMHSSAIDSPRGMLNTHSDANLILGDAMLMEPIKSDRGYMLGTEKKLDSAGKLWKTFEIPAEPIMSGWNNPFLCI